MFLDGVAFQAPTPGGFPGGIHNVTWQGMFFSVTPGLNIQWQWAAAVYRNANFTADYNALGVKPVDDNKASVYKNSDHAGTPENFKRLRDGRRERRRRIEFHGLVQRDGRGHSDAGRHDGRVRAAVNRSLESIGSADYPLREDAGRCDDCRPCVQQIAEAHHEFLTELPRGGQIVRPRRSRGTAKSPAADAVAIRSINRSTSAAQNDGDPPYVLKRVGQKRGERRGAMLLQGPNVRFEGGQRLRPDLPQVRAELRQARLDRRRGVGVAAASSR